MSEDDEWINERMRKKSELGAEIRCTTYSGENIFTFMKVPRQCPIVLLVKICWREGKAFGSEEGRQMEWWAWREVEQGTTAVDLKPEFKYKFLEDGNWWNFAFNVGLATLGRNFDVNIGSSAWVSCSATWNFGTSSAFDLRPRKATENLDRFGRSQYLPHA
jgi:hypothetical protein